MRFEDYTKPQQQAITLKGSNIIVSAGAGSGKTQVLTQRVIYFIKNEHYKLDEFLILTFTNLAAGEMKERIRKELKEQHMKEQEDVDASDICTFDSYALSLVKKYHFMLKVSPNVSIIDSNIIDVRKRTIINELFDEEYINLDKDFVSLIERFCFKSDFDLQNLVLKLYNKALLEIDTDAYLDDFVDKYYHDEIIELMQNQMLESFTKKRNTILNLLQILPEFDLKKGTNVEEYQSILAKLINASTYEEFVTSLNGEIKFSSLSKGIGEELPTLKEINDSLKKEINGLKSYLDKLPYSNEEFVLYFKDNIAFANVLIKIIKKLDIRIKEYKKHHDVYEFQDIAKMALNLVKTNKEVKDSIKNKLKMIMIDEYQDTSLLQEAFIHCIENNNVYMVGDVKQSIYRFRNARCDIFVDKYNKYKQNIGGVALDLNKNFRSRKEVLQDINYIFRQIMSEPCGGANYEKEHLIEYGNKAYLKAKDENINNHLSFIFYDTDLQNKDNLKKEELEAHLIAKDIINRINKKYKVMDFKDKAPILRECGFSDFCILMDRGTSFELYAKVFSEYKIPLFVENDEDISSNELVVVLTNLLILIKDIQNKDYSASFIKAFLSLARSYLFEYNDQRIYDLVINNDIQNDEMIIRLKSIINISQHLSISSLIEKIIYEFDVYNKCILLGNVNKNEKYIDTFLNMFKSMNKLDYSIDDFILYMQYIDEYNLKITLSSSSSTLDSVRIMNIHKSKGLEFNFVYYSGLSKRFNAQDLKSDFNISSKYGLILPPKVAGNINIVKEFNSNYELEEDISEKVRLFYVALTRTREQMICLMDNVNSYETLAMYARLYNDIKQDYCARNNFDNLDDFEKFKCIFSDYKKHLIGSTVFESLVKDFKICLPLEFINLDNDIKRLIDIDILLNYLENVENKKIAFLNQIEKLKEKLLKETNSPLEIIKLAFTYYQNKHITHKQFRIIVDDFNYELNNKYYAQFEKNKNKEDDEEIINDNEEADFMFKNKHKFNIEALQNNILDVKKINLDRDEFDQFDPSLISLNDNMLVKKHLYLEKEIEDYLDSNIDIIFKASKKLESKEISIEDFRAFINLLNYDIEKTAVEYFEKNKALPSIVLYSSLYRIKNDFVDKKTFIKLVKEKYFEQKNDETIFTMFILYFGYIPFFDNLLNSIDKTSLNELDAPSFLKVLNYIGFDTKHEFKLLTNKESVELFKKCLCNEIVIKERYFEHLLKSEKFLEENVLKVIFNDYKNGLFDYDLLKRCFKCLNFGIDNDFEELNEVEKKAFSVGLIDSIVHEMGILNNTVNEAKNFKDFILPYINYRRFKHYVVDSDIVYNKIDLEHKKMEYENFIIKELNILKEPLEIFKASKELNLQASKKNMEFGTKIHFIMEMMDFKNPNYSLISPYFQNIVKRFLNSTIMQNVANGLVYKEYEFIDELNNTNGIIDLMIIYDDHIDIIDYKTRNIDDESYNKQLKIYEGFAKNKFNKKVDTYLYSLMEGNYIKCN